MTAVFPISLTPVTLVSVSFRNYTTQVGFAMLVRPITLLDYNFQVTDYNVDS